MISLPDMPKRIARLGALYELKRLRADAMRLLPAA
jgi:hypothetical protein